MWKTPRLNKEFHSFSTIPRFTMAILPFFGPRTHAFSCRHESNWLNSLPKSRKTKLFLLWSLSANECTYRSRYDFSRISSVLTTTHAFLSRLFCFSFSFHAKSHFFCNFAFPLGFSTLALCWKKLLGCTFILIGIYTFEQMFSILPIYCVKNTKCSFIYSDHKCNITWVFLINARKPWRWLADFRSSPLPINSCRPSFRPFSID